MGIFRSVLKAIGGRAGNASRAKRGANSHVNTKSNKRAANKAVRVSRRADLLREIDGTRTGRFTHSYSNIEEKPHEQDS